MNMITLCCKKYRYVKTKDAFPEIRLICTKDLDQFDDDEFGCEYYYIEYWRYENDTNSMSKSPPFNKCDDAWFWLSKFVDQSPIVGIDGGIIPNWWGGSV